MMLLTEDQALELLASECRAAGGQQAWAQRHRISAQYVCDALRRRRALGQKLTKALGLRFVAMYELKK